MKKRMLSLCLVLALLVQLIPAALAQEIASAPDAAKPYEAVWTEHGCTLRDQTIRGDLVLDGTQSLYIDGTIAFAGGGRMVVRGGAHTLSRDAVIRGDIAVQGACELTILGLVQGEMRLECPGQEDETYIRLGETCVLRALTGTTFNGTVHISGSVARIALGGEEESPSGAYGEVCIVGDGYADEVTIAGAFGPEVMIRGNALVGSLALSGACSGYLDGGYARVVSVGADARLGIVENCRVGELIVRGVGAGVAMNRGGYADVIRIEKVQAESDALGTVTGSGVWMYAGAGAGTAYVGERGLLAIKPVSLHEADTLSDTPVGELDWSSLYEKTRVEKVYVSAGGHVQNSGRIDEAHIEGDALYTQDGSVGALYARGGKLRFGIPDPAFDSQYSNNVVRRINWTLYADGAADYIQARGSDVTLQYGASLGTVVLDACHVSLRDVEHIDTLVLSKPRQLGLCVEEAVYGSMSDPKRTIDRLFLSGCNEGNTWQDDRLRLKAERVCVLSGIAPGLDAARLYLPAGATDARGAMVYRKGDGVRVGLTEAERAAEVAEAGAGEDLRATNGSGQEILRQNEVRAVYVGEAVAVSAQDRGGQDAPGSISEGKPALLPEGEYDILKTSARDWWYALETQPLEEVTLTLDAGEGMGALIALEPDGRAHPLISEGGTASLSFISRAGGEITLRLVGAKNDYHLGVGVAAPSRVAWDARMQRAAADGRGERTALPLADVSLRVENLTKGTSPQALIVGDALVMTRDQAAPGDALRLTLTSPEGAFLPAEVLATLDAGGNASASGVVYEYGSYSVTCREAEDVTVHLYDGEGAYVARVERHGANFLAEGLAPGAYQAVLIRGDVGRWRFESLDDYAAFGLREGTDYRVDRFTLEPGWYDYYPNATVPDAPAMDSPYVIEGDSRYEAARAACLKGGSSLMRASFALQNLAEIDGCVVKIELSPGMRVDPGAVTLNGESAACDVEDGVLRVPVPAGVASGQIAFYAWDDGAREMLSIARLELDTARGVELAYLGFCAQEVQTLSIRGSAKSAGTVNLYGYGVPGETVTLRRDGAAAGSAKCDNMGAWHRTLYVTAGATSEQYAFTAALYAGTADELTSDPLLVTVWSEYPELESLKLYYYEHETLRKLELTAEQFYQGKLTYDCLPGSQYTYFIKLKGGEDVERLYHVTRDPAGAATYHACAYDEASGEWSVTGTFPYTKMGDTFELAYDLRPLPEPQPLTQADYEMLEQEAPIEVQDVSMTLTEDFEAEGRVDLLVAGMPYSVEIHAGLAGETVDLEQVRADALQRYDLEGGAQAYLMGEADDPFSQYLVFVDADELTAFEAADRDADGGLDILFYAFGLLSSARADTFDWIIETFINTVSVGAVLSAMVVSGVLGGIVSLYFRDVQLVRLLSLRNKTYELQDQLMREEQSAATPKKRLCLLAVRDMCDTLLGDISQAANKYGREAIIDGMCALLALECPAIVAARSADAVKRVNAFRAVFTKAQTARDKLLAVKEELTARIAGLIDEIARCGDELVNKRLHALLPAIRNTAKAVGDICARVKKNWDDFDAITQSFSVKIDKKLRQQARASQELEKLAAKPAGMTNKQYKRELRNWQRNLDRANVALKNYKKRMMEKLSALEGESDSVMRDAMSKLRGAWGTPTLEGLGKTLREISEMRVEQQVRLERLNALASSGVGAVEELQQMASRMDNALKQSLRNGEISIEQYNDMVSNQYQPLMRMMREAQQRLNIQEMQILVEQLGLPTMTVAKLADTFLQCKSVLEAFNAAEQERAAALQRVGARIRERDEKKAELEETEKAIQEKEAEMQDCVENATEDAKGLEKNVVSACAEIAKRACQLMYEMYLKDYDVVYNQYLFVTQQARLCRDSDEEEDPEPDPEKNPPIDPGITGGDNPKPDPSGYVYEGMWSNRLPGVTVTAMTQNIEGGEETWDAQAYGQRNPLVTDENGYYEWYVPEGMWRVIYEKEGYETATSAWLAVPPPQTEVHQALVSLAPPRVRYACHYGEYVELAFDRPVRVDSVDGASVRLEGGFTARAVDAERDGDSPNVLARVFRLVPEGRLREEINLTVTPDVVSYAGTGAEETALTLTRQQPLEGLSAPESVRAAVGAETTLTVRALGAGDFERYALRVEGAHEDLLRVVSVGAFDENGEAEVTIFAAAACALTLTFRASDAASGADTAWAANVAYEAAP